MLISAYFASLSPLALFRALPGSIVKDIPADSDGDDDVVIYLWA